MFGKGLRLKENVIEEYKHYIENSEWTTRKSIDRHIQQILSEITEIKSEKKI